MPFPDPSRSTRALAARLCAAAAVALAAALLPAPGGAGRAEAQLVCKTSCTPPAECPPEGCEDSNPPQISINPEGASVQSPSLVVQLTFYDLEGNAYGPNDVVRLNGVVVTPTHDGGSSTYVHQYTRTTSYWLRRGTNTLEVRSCDAGGNCATKTATYVYTPPAASAAFHNGEHRSVAEGGATLGYAMPAYVSLDVPRSASLFYASGQAAPTGVVRLVVEDPDTVTITRITAGLRRPDGTWVKLRVGGREADETVLRGTRQGSYHFGLQFDASGLATGAYDHTVVVRRWWADGTFTESATPVRVLVVNERSSPFGAGWSMPGLQRLHFGNPAGVLLTGGDGTALFFARSGSGFESPSGDFSTLVADSTGYRRRASDGTESHFGLDGRLRHVRDRFGSQTTFTYTGAQLTAVTDPAGKQVTFGYGADGRLAWMRDPVGRVASMSYTGAGLTRVLDPDSAAALQVTYDSTYRATGWTPRGGGRWDAAYDTHGTLAALTAPTVTAGGRSMRPVTRHASVEASLLPAAGTGTVAAPATAPVTEYDIGARVTGPNGASVWNALDRLGLPVSTRLPDGFHVGTTRDAHGRPRFVTTRSLDSSGGVRTTEYVYSADRANPHPVLVIDHTTRDTVQTFYRAPYFQVDSVRRGGRLLSRSFFSGTPPRADSVWARLPDGTGAVSRYTYDARGRLLTFTDPRGRRTTTVYETTGMQNTRTITRPASTGASTTTFGYDAAGRTTSVTNPLGQAVTTEYDALNRTRRVSAPLAAEIRYGGDEATGTHTVTDALGQVYTSRTNALGWVESLTDPRGVQESFRYDSAGALTGYTNRRGQTVSTTYDAAGRPRTVTADGRTTTFAYDSLRRWVAVSNAESTDTTFFDEGGRVRKEVAVRGGRRSVVASGYGATGLREWVVDTLAGPAAGTVYAYSAEGRLERITAFGVPATHGYDAAGLPDTVAYATGTRYLLGFTGGDALQSRRYFDAALDAVAGRTYQRDTLERASRVWTGVSGEDRQLRYDALGRLRRYVDQQQGAAVRADTFAFDAVGNRTDRGASVEQGNRLASFDGWTLTYDADGNLVRKLKAGVSDQSFTWNALGQLVEVRDASGRVVTFGYDGWGRRARKTVDGVTTRYVWDGENLSAEVDASGAPVREYAYYPGVDVPYAVRRASDGKVFFYHLEAPGHVTALVDGANRVAARYRYDPWGVAQATVDTVAQPLRYGAREWDAETGLYYNRARYYDPRLGRFISEDPIGLAGGINPYAYVGNDPVGYLDPSGLCRENTYGEPCPIEGVTAYGHRGEGDGTGNSGSGYGRRGSFGWSVGGVIDIRIDDALRERAARWFRQASEAQDREIAKGCLANAAEFGMDVALDAAAAKTLGLLAHAGSARVLSRGVGGMHRAAARAFNKGDDFGGVLMTQMGNRMLSDAQLHSELATGASAVVAGKAAMTQWPNFVTNPGSAVYEGLKLAPGGGSVLSGIEMVRACLQ